MARPRPLAPLAAASAALLLALCLPAAVAAQHGADDASYKILTVVHVGGSSHTFDLVKVAANLAKRHNVTVVAPTADLAHTTAAARRLGKDAGPLTFETSTELISLQMFIGRMGGIRGKGGRLEMLRKMSQMPYWAAQACEALLANETRMQAWASYDVILTFPFPPPAEDGCMCLLSHVLGIPLAYVSDFVLMHAPINVPQFASGLTRAEVQGTWLGAAKNAGHWLMQQGMMRTMAWAEVSSYRRLRARLGLPLGRGRTCRPVVDVLSSNWLLEEPQPLEPYQVMVGALSPHPSHPDIADPQIAAFAADAAASDGLVLVSFGSVSAMFGKSLDATDYTNLALAFSDLAPVRVLWLLSPKALPNGTEPSSLPLGNNTLMVPWGPINDVLGHPSCRAFVTHSGMKSTFEAMFHGVPIVAVPFMSEQLHNAERAAARGFGVVSPEAPGLRQDGQRYTREGVAAFVREVLTPQYANAAARVGEAMRLAYRQRRPVDRAADEIELAMLHRGYAAAGDVVAALQRPATAQAEGAAAEGADAAIAAAASAASLAGTRQEL